MSGSEVGILRENASERMKDISFRISATGEAFVVQLCFCFPLFVDAIFFILISLSRSHCWICRAHPFALFVVCVLSNTSSACLNFGVLLQGTHGSVHDPNGSAAGGGNAEESNGESQQERPPAALLSLTGQL